MTTGPETESATTTGAGMTGVMTIEVAMMTDVMTGGMTGVMTGGMTGIATTTAAMTGDAMIATMTDAERTAETEAATSRAEEGACEHRRGCPGVAFPAFHAPSEASTPEILITLKCCAQA